jgi:electron transport complex protein RnfG
MYRAMVGVGLACGLLIVSVFQWTRPIIAKNRAEALERAIFQVLPDARSSTTFRLTDDERFERLTEEAGTGRLIYAGYDDDGRLVGLAIEAEGMGYADVIKILYGYSFGQEAVVGIRVLESRETPGLGDKIEKDPEFLENFKRLDVSLTEDGSEILNPVEAVKHGQKEHDWQVDGITGATISSFTIADILNRSTAYWVPLIRRSLSDFEDDGGNDAG